ncbi:hypothetical protein Ndes2526B_g01572 [Nannochloris sp. 'desiccata']
MAIAEAANNFIGGVGGFVLAACLLPQLLRLYITRSAFDLSYFFLVFFIIGLMFTALYMFNVDALVGFISVIVEGVFAIFMLAGKIYLDNWGPYSERVKRTSGAASGLTIPARARLEMSKFLSGTAGAPFPKLLQAEEAHAAAHLLLDCQLEFLENSTTTTIATTKKAGVNDKVESKQLPSLSEVEDGIVSSARLPHSKSHIARLHLSEFVDMLEGCLENADLDVYKRQTHAFHSFKQRPSILTNTSSSLVSAPDSLLGNGDTILSAATTKTTDGGSSSGGAHLCFIPCKDGYCSAMWLPESSTLAVDLVGAAPETIHGMNTAAEMFCKELTKAHPGAKIVASAVSRLPAQ